MEILNEESFNLPKTNLIIQIVGKEGNCPHIHIKEKTTVICRIKLFSNEYTEVDKKVRDLNRKERKFLDEYLREINQRNNESNWDILINSWIKANANAKIGVKPESQPSYLVISDEIKGSQNSHSKNLQKKLNQINEALLYAPVLSDEYDELKDMQSSVLLEMQQLNIEPNMRILHEENNGNF